MTEHRQVLVGRWSPGRNSADAPALSRLLGAYHLQTEAEKGVAVARVAELAERYRLGQR